MGEEKRDSANWYSDSASGVAGSLEEEKRDAANWYSDSASGIAGTLEKKSEEAANWYSDSASGVVGSLKDKKRDDSANWYSDSASGVVGSLEVKERDTSANWYSDSAAGVVASLEGEKRDTSANWYSDSASGVAGSLKEKKRGDDANWYSDSASGVAGSLESKRDDSANWYSDSASGVVGSLKEKRDGSANWYSDSASGVAGTLKDEKRADEANWYSDSASGVAGSLEGEKRGMKIPRIPEANAFLRHIIEAGAKRSLSAPEKQSYEKALRDWVYYDMRNKALRDTSERGKALFDFTPKPRNDVVDRWHVPDELLARYNVATSDAERVSVLNYYLMVTGREVKSAKELGFTPTSDIPVLPETNEIGYGYVLAGQHQYHCVDFVADAVDVGKERLNDFYLKHTIHCLGLFKWLTPQLTMKLPLGFFTPIAEQRKVSHYPQTIEELDAYKDGLDK